MDFGFDVTGAVAGVSEARSGLSGKFTMIMIIAVIGLVGRQVFVAFGPSLKFSNPFARFSGFGLIGVAMAVFVGGLLVSGKGRTALIQLQRNISDPFIVSVLERDSCDVASGAYCVVVFEGEREIVVNWFDKRVDMFAIANPRTEVHWLTVRPQLRPETALLAGG
ncbi:hypothetical protein TRL7639_01950 [Falsiruegeria litorea R37]|uniref:Uncharacterized protein n=1 Tax=Falsiruegeria litorea R37 TaxID=1200284 RepID=A0A1Y5SE31_9RHOB|nr:hypothetical protein [Falsiruegeria litorea]SLN38623.1 hypothetical protein TRL7639_01950 [Falsiruegeria litorea R37]